MSITPDSKYVGQYFQAKEFACGCGCGARDVRSELVQILDDVRKSLGTPLRITSGLRCSSHNKDSGGALNSYHMARSDGKGYAADVTYSASNMKTPINIIRLYTMLDKFSGDLATGIIAYPSWVHVDVRGVGGRDRYRSLSKFPFPNL